MYYTNYKDSNWSFRFRILELICCVALIVLALLLLILVPDIKIFIVVPVLVIGAAFALICFYNLFAFGSEATQRLFRSWIFFAAAGMLLFFLAAGLLIVPIKFLFQSDILFLAATFAILNGIIFLFDMLFTLRILHMNIIPEQPQDRRLPITVPIKTTEDCDHCRQRREEGFPCDEEICGVKINPTKSTQMSFHKPPEKVESVELIEEKLVNMHEPEHLPDPCPSIVCRESRKLHKPPSCLRTCEFIQSSKSVQVQPEPSKLSCDLNTCKKKVLKTTRSTQVSQEFDKLSVKSIKSSKRSARVSPQISEAPTIRSNISSIEKHIVTVDRSTCTEKKCLQRYDEYSAPVMKSKKRTPDPFISKIPPKTPIIPEIQILDLDDKCTKKCGKDDRFVCKTNCCTQATSTENINPNDRGAFKSGLPDKKPEIVPSLDRHRTSQNIFFPHGQVQTLDKAIQISDIKECKNENCQTSDKPKKLVSKKISKTLQTSEYLLPQQPKTPVVQKTDASQTYDAEISSKHPYIILVKECDNSASCPKPTEIVNVRPKKPPETSKVKTDHIHSKETLKDVFIQVTDTSETKKVTPETSAQSVQQKETDSKLKTPDSQTKSTQFSNKFCVCENHSSFDEIVCVDCCQKSKEDNVKQYPQIERQLSINIDNILAQQPYARSPKRNGLDEDNRIIKQASPIFNYISHPIPRKPSSKSKIKTYSARIESVTPKVMKTKQRSSLPVSATAVKKKPKETDSTKNVPSSTSAKK